MHIGRYINGFGVIDIMELPWDEAEKLMKEHPEIVQELEKREISSITNQLKKFVEDYRKFLALRYIIYNKMEEARKKGDVEEHEKYLRMLQELENQKFAFIAEIGSREGFIEALEKYGLTQHSIFTDQQVIKYLMPTLLFIIGLQILKSQE